MSVIVCDASPLIFLAKIDQLDLIAGVLDGEIHVLKCVVDELGAGDSEPLEAVRLRRFLAQVTVVDFESSDFPSHALSRSDQSTLSWAIENRADWLVADERLMRRVANESGIRNIGFLGLLVGAARRGLITAHEARLATDEAISQHHCRISVELYQRVLSELQDV